MEKEEDDDGNRVSVDERWRVGDWIDELLRSARSVDGEGRAV
jgi:hypothetical protein